MKSGLLLLAAVCVAAHSNTLAQTASRAATSAMPRLENLDAAQQTAFDSMDPALASGAAAARDAFVAATFADPRNDTELSARLKELGDAELRLVEARADAVARLENSGHPLAAGQIASLIRQPPAGRGGARGAQPAPAVPARGAGRGAPANQPPAQTAESPAMTRPVVPGLVPAGDARIRYMGRWERKPETATTVNSGSAIRFRFEGAGLKGSFQPVTAAPQIYVTIDQGQKTMLNVNAPEIDLAPGGLSSGSHMVEIEVKDVNQNANRWNPPLQSAVIFLGFVLGTNAAALDPGPALTGRWAPGALKMEFYGDSITEGVRVLSMATTPDGSDGTKTYSYLAGLALGANITQVGFGAQAIMRGGGGGVPSASVAFSDNFAGSRRDSNAPEPQVVVINQGTNDRGTSPVQFEPTYLAFLKQVRAAYPNALIAAMRPFNGAQDGAIYSAVRSMSDSRVVYIDTAGWLEVSNSPDYTEQPTGLHPSLVGHAKAAERLVAALRAVGVGQTPPASQSR